MLFSEDQEQGSYHLGSLQFCPTLYRKSSKSRKNRGRHINENKSYMKRSKTTYMLHNCEHKEIQANIQKKKNLEGKVKVFLYTNHK